ncbi:MAG: OmpA family protein, partial [Gammaproteobacteria bacterium]|nr:OmpA family protein [Gammaproteobacteria bacterium]
DNPLRVAMQGGDAVGEQSRLIPGGGDDFRLQDGEVFRGDLRSADLQETLAALETAEFEALKQRIEEAIDASEMLSQYRDQLLIEITDEGLRIQIIDLEGRPMFERGSPELQAHTIEILDELAALLNTVGNRVSITGHTDATPFAAGEAGYSNWELSNDRANAARRQLVASGMDPNKIMRIVGLASTVLLDDEDPANPMNRRVSILVLNRAAEQAIRDDGVTAEDRERRL